MSVAEGEVGTGGGGKEGASLKMKENMRNM